MAVVTKVGRQSWPVATFLTFSYLVLTAGGISMVVPFLIMLTSAVSNSWDYEQFHPLPTYLWNREERYMKFLAEKYLDIAAPRVRVSRDFRLFSAAYHPRSEWQSFRNMREDEAFFETPPFCFGSENGRQKQLETQLADYRDWLTQYDRPLLTLPMFARFTRVRYQTTMREFYEREYLAREGLDRAALSGRALEEGGLAVLADRWQEAKFKHFFFLELMVEGSYPYHLRSWLPPLDEKRWQDYCRFVRELPAEWKTPITAQHLWLRFLENAVSDLDAFRARTGLNVSGLHDVPFPETEPTNPRLQQLWQTFVQEKWPIWMVELPPERASGYRAYLRERTGSIERYNRMVKADHADWESVPWTGRPPRAPLARNFWRDYLLQLPPAELANYRVSPEMSYREFLQTRYGDVGHLNRAYGWDATEFASVQIPVADIDYAQFLAQEGWVMRTFLTFNLHQVFRYMAVQGRALLNTAILVGLSILTCLTVNPLAAYALSRFHMRQTQKILLFLLATMAFPHEVSMIPNFLLLREFGLLNTYAALVLPRLANGFGIFLLKGFFDSLPAELYEAATIDGAGEFVMFSRITLPLCKPILAYQALLTFIATYGGFMWAFLVCQDSRMWTVMVWIYQYQQTAQAFPYMVMAAFVLASIPTLIVFLFCQKIILRGIIIPTMK
ncbi:MAG: carbohydrate ABC transporter permease [Lentisphaerae bacterium]|jgi:ABC-type glycerol-3-phosphate transport system permease component|nr:carbohydrate ABC transporter permease [Lentisphaerota bacterium]MBT4821823.1 carbohydrate ABC transporter permease [Lentisphaerota bacterium]MBT5612621.1 carbohydrate ABC transporter permease [Lentisphaerota bacterium]MBT7057957.1 carbohydrate ABC transporter permease [Lentisphaerota bacterium]MBT7846440.1 carbohydrate ABC transporter permease [Lentisphaerota bacterium]